MCVMFSTESVLITQVVFIVFFIFYLLYFFGDALIMTYRNVKSKPFHLGQWVNNNHNVLLKFLINVTECYFSKNYSNHKLHPVQLVSNVNICSFVNKKKSLIHFMIVDH